MDKSINEGDKSIYWVTYYYGGRKLPQLPMCWQQPNHFISVGGISHAISRTRFQLIIWFVHLADSSQQVLQGEPGHEKLYKARKLLDILKTQFQLNYTPSEMSPLMKP